MAKHQTDFIISAPNHILIHNYFSERRTLCKEVVYLIHVQAKISSELADIEVNSVCRTVIVVLASIILIVISAPGIEVPVGLSIALSIAELFRLIVHDERNARIGNFRNIEKDSARYTVSQILKCMEHTENKFSSMTGSIIGEILEVIENLQEIIKSPNELQSTIVIVKKQEPLLLKNTQKQIMLLCHKLSRIDAIIGKNATAIDEYLEIAKRYNDQQWQKQMQVDKIDPIDALKKSAVCAATWTNEFFKKMKLYAAKSYINH